MCFYNCGGLLSLRVFVLDGFLFAVLLFGYCCDCLDLF